jgi:ATP-dependent exoDNAse (exonuclease V) alpha subunit
MAGTGKSYEARAYLASMAAGGARVVAVGPTIKAAANVGGITVHALYEMRQPEHFADPPPTETLRAVARRYDAILVDEAFMCTGWMLETFLALRRAGVRFVLAGDPEQLPPVFTTAPPPAQVARSALVHELVDGRVRTLVDPRRSMGVPRAPGTMDLLLACRALLEAPPTREANARFAALFRVAEASQDLPRRNLAYLNATCARVNRELVLRRARGRAWLVDGTVCVGAWALRRALRPESVVFATGAPVIARSAAYAARGKRLVVGALAPLGPLALESARQHMPGTATIGAARVPLADVPLAFELAFCVTIHRAQCETIDEPYVVHDLERILAMPARAARAMLYVAVSRARSAALVSFAA